MAELSSRAVERLGEPLDIDDERVRLEAARGDPRPTSGQASNPDGTPEADGHIAALIEVTRRRALEPILVEDVEVEISTSAPKAT